MKFTDLDRKMRVYETSHDHCVLPGIFMVARIDGRCFSTLTKEIHDFEAPYDLRFRDYMITTIRHLMGCGFRVVFAYSQSDEINLLLHRNETSFSRKLRKYNSVLASEASAAFTHAFGHIASFDSRISQLPRLEDVLDYFQWRQEDAFRNALNGHCYWYYRKEGKTDTEAHKLLMNVSNADKNELLFSKANINFNDVPLWQKRGFALYWKQVEKEGVNPKTGETNISLKKELHVDLEIPMKNDFREFLRTLIEA